MMINYDKGNLSGESIFCQTVHVYDHIADFIEVFLQMLMKITDVFMLSFVSDQAVAAIGIVNHLITFMFLMFNFIAMGTE